MEIINTIVSVIAVILAVVWVILFFICWKTDRKHNPVQNVYMLVLDDDVRVRFERVKQECEDDDA